MANDARTQVEAFFEQQLPKVIAARQDVFASSKGALTIIVEGAGSWTVHFGARNLKNAIVDEGDPDADRMAVWLLPALEDARALVKNLNKQGRGTEALAAATFFKFVDFRDNDAGARITATDLNRARDYAAAC